MELINRPKFDINKLKPKFGGVAFYIDDENDPFWSEKRLGEAVSKALNDHYYVIYAEVPRKGV